MRQPKWVVEKLNRAISKVRFEDAGFSFSKDQLEYLLKHLVEQPDHTWAIRKVTRLYVETWIVPLLEKVRDGERY